MKIRLNGMTLQGTAIAILDDLKTKAWDADEYATTEEYLENNLKATYKRMCDKEMPLPEGSSLEDRATAALEALADIKLIEIEEE